MNLTSSRRKLSVLSALILVFALVLAACSGGSAPSNNSANKGSASEDTQEEVVIRLWTAEGAFDGEQSPGQQMIKAFNEKYAGQIRVKPNMNHGRAITPRFKRPMLQATSRIFSNCL